MRTLLVAITCLTFPASSLGAVGEWPEFMKQQFIDSSCVPSLEAEGYSAADVQTFCLCFADQIEANFSPFEYEDILAAQPNPSGSSADQRLYGSLMVCRPLQ